MKSLILSVGLILGSLNAYSQSTFGGQSNPSGAGLGGAMGGATSTAPATAPTNSTTLPNSVSPGLGGGQQQMQDTSGAQAPGTNVPSTMNPPPTSALPSGTGLSSPGGSTPSGTGVGTGAPTSY
jgi:hypothetical protein